MVVALLSVPASAADYSPWRRDPMIGGRVPRATIDAMDKWAKANELTRSEAMGQLIEAGLKRPPKVRPKA